MASKNKKIFECWSLIQEIVGPAKLWPKLARRLCWTPNLKHFNRILLVTFFYINGLDPSIFMEWVELLNLGTDRAAQNHYAALYKMFRNGHYYNMYGWHVSNGRYEYLNGNIRYYVPKHARK